ncbi:PspA-associated protein PspAA [Kitasatospora sp. LaBMicrA B282]|uniref:PspA-associated protein PspAA n=1 Tax=Kitasatospora sp. LaBMicrA B282 TaxID=3420949 RepID=UPI003D11B086
MIMRIMGEGQFQVSDEHLHRLNQLDDELLTALDSGDETAFRGTLDNLLTAVRQVGVPMAADYLGPSDAILPDAGATIDQVHQLLRAEGDGLIPGIPE